jgi:hypothetical protein
MARFSPLLKSASLTPLLYLFPPLQIASVSADHDKQPLTQSQRISLANVQ